MARLSTDGIDELEKKLQAISAGLRGQAVTDMLNAGGEVLKEAWMNEIDAYHHVRTGAMKENVSVSPVHFDGAGGYVEVYPTGTDSHRITNAQKAYILHYGRAPKKTGTKGIKGDRFVTKAEREARARATEVMQQKLNEYIAGKE